MKEMLKIARGGFTHWRDYRKWKGLEPEQELFGHVMKEAVPNTKYGNALVPWLMRLHKNGHIRIDNARAGRNFVDAAKRVNRAQERLQAAQESGSERWQTYWTKHLRDAQENKEYHRGELSNYYAPDASIKGWEGEDDYGNPYEDGAPLEDALPEIIEAQKIAKRKGQEPINPMAFADPKGLQTVMKRQYTERMKDSGKIVHPFPNGWSIRKLVTPEDAKYEGRLMDNCVGDYHDDLQPRPLFPDGTGSGYGPRHIYSLRDPKNKPHVSFGIIDERHGSHLSSVYGKGNEEPKDMYAAALKEWMEAQWPNVADRPRSEEGEVSVRNHMGIGQAPVDRYGAPGELDYQWKRLVHSAWAHDPAGNNQPGYYPENIQKVFQAAQQAREGDQLGGAVWNHAQDMTDFLKQRQQEGEAGAPAYQGTLTSPWALTLRDFQQHLTDNEPTYNPEAQGTGNILQHYGSTTRPHIGANGKLCECPYGEFRPEWDPEWEFHTNWTDEDRGWG